MKILSLKNKKNGFTLVELLITIVIFVILTGVVLFNQSSFDNGILLKNMAYDMALTIRQAQVYGTNIRESSVTGTFSSYGIYFNPVVSNKSYILFADTKDDEDKNFDGTIGCLSSDEECIQKYTLRRNTTISRICAGSNATDCTTVDNLTIYFARPNPEAIITSLNGSGTKSAPYGYAEITISSPSNATSTVVITSPGQIYIKK